jgi:hypothetical protein
VCHLCELTSLSHRVSSWARTAVAATLFYIERARPLRPTCILPDNPAEHTYQVRVTRTNPSGFELLKQTQTLTVISMSKTGVHIFGSASASAYWYVRRQQAHLSQPSSTSLCVAWPLYEVESKMTQCSSHRFAQLLKQGLEQGDLGALQQLDCHALVTRLVVKSPSELAEQLESKETTRLNSKQMVFATPATSWLDWGTSIGPSPDERAASALDFVGWERDGIDWARKEGLHARLYVWEGGAGASSGSSLATWDLVFDEILPRCARGGATFLAKGQDKPKGWGDEDTGNNEKFVALAQRLRGAIEVVEWKKDPCVGVPEVLAAAEEEQPCKIRQALRNILYLEPLFKGDGFTRNQAGEKKAAEMIVETRALAELEGLQFVELGAV